MVHAKIKMIEKNKNEKDIIIPLLTSFDIFPFEDLPLFLVPVEAAAVAVLHLVVVEEEEAAVLHLVVVEEEVAVALHLVAEEEAVVVEH